LLPVLVIRKNELLKFDFFFTVPLHDFLDVLALIHEADERTDCLGGESFEYFVLRAESVNEVLGVASGMGRIRGQEAKKRVENVLLESKGVSLAL
jgi:hypothetical protein